MTGSIHDIESYSSFAQDQTSSLNISIFLCHWGHLAIILLWLSRIHFHVGSQGNYELWCSNPINRIPVAHSVFDPHFALLDTTNKISDSGIYNNLLSLGFNNVFEIYNIVITSELAALISIGLASIHLIYLDVSFQNLYATFTSVSSWTYKLLLIYFDLGSTRLNYHLCILSGVTSISWSAHLIHLAIPAATGVQHTSISIRNSFTSTLYTGNWAYDIASMDKDSNVFASSVYAGSSLITFFGGLKPDTMSLYLTDISHHHLSIGVIFVLSGHLYSSFYKATVRVTLWGSHMSVHFSLSLISTFIAVVTSAFASQVSLATPYVYLSYDYVTTLALYVHHQYIASLLMMSGMVHASIWMITDDFAPLGYHMKSHLISHLSWVCLYLGFHTLGVYTHNDTVSAFGQSFSQILIEPVFATHLSMRFTALQPLGPGDLLSHHAISLGLHVTVLILLKGSLDASGSKLIPDKLHFALGFACDGPNQGGTCDVSAFDSIYLGFFWMLNTHAWLAFYFHFQHLQLFSSQASVQSSNYLNGWFRDYLFFHSAALVNGYNAFGANDLSVLSWIFLYAHLCWATGFMFLISWRGYWQELIDILLSMHLKTPVMYDLWSGGISMYTPIALSILQARFIGLVHFSAGFILTYAAFIVGATS